jgi:hypothetical protein
VHRLTARASGEQKEEIQMSLSGDLRLRT